MRLRDEDNFGLFKLQARVIQVVNCGCFQQDVFFLGLPPKTLCHFSIRLGLLRSRDMIRQLLTFTCYDFRHLAIPPLHHSGIEYRLRLIVGSQKSSYNTPFFTTQTPPPPHTHTHQETNCFTVALIRFSSEGSMKLSNNVF